MNELGLGLPPRVGEIANGSVTWERIEGIEYDLIGYFLSCHLVIEHYLEEYLKVTYPALKWDDARLTFAKKLSLLSGFKVSDRYDCIPAVKHLNALRNKLAHDLRFKIGTDSLQPLTHYLLKVYDKAALVPSDPKAVLSHFTTMVCVLFASQISYKAQFAK
jgi:hypothetical protein